MTKERDIESFIAGARWARMAADKAFDDALLDQDAKHFADTGGNIRCRGEGTLQHFLRSAAEPPQSRSVQRRMAHMRGEPQPEFGSSVEPTPRQPNAWTCSCGQDNLLPDDKVCVACGEPPAEPSANADPYQCSGRNLVKGDPCLCVCHGFDERTAVAVPTPLERALDATRPDAKAVNEALIALGLAERTT